MFFKIAFFVASFFSSFVCSLILRPTNSRKLLARFIGNFQLSFVFLYFRERFYWTCRQNYPLRGNFSASFVRSICEEWKTNLNIDGRFPFRTETSRLVNNFRCFFFSGGPQESSSTNFLVNLVTKN